MDLCDELGPAGITAVCVCVCVGVWVLVGYARYAVHCVRYLLYIYFI